MNRIDVIAQGAPGSFIRRIQEEPQIVLEIILSLKRVIEDFDDGQSESIDAAKNILNKHHLANYQTPKMD